jgi:hypothetical protein
MNIYVVSRPGQKPEGAFETFKLAADYIQERIAETDERGHEITTHELVRTSDRPRADILSYQG